MFLSLVAYGLTTNTDVTRTIDATSAIVKITIDIKAEDIENNQYNIVFNTEQNNHLSFLSVKENKNVLTTSMSTNE